MQSPIYPKELQSNVAAFPGISAPRTDFDAVRDNRLSSLLYVDIDLSSARSVAAGSALVVNISGNSFYIDADTVNTGNAVVHFQDTSFSIADAPVYVMPGFIASVPFTQLLIENTAQAGKRLRIFYGVDIDFTPGQNPTVTMSGAVRSNFSNTNITVTNTSQQFLAANSARNYLTVQNKDATGSIYVTFGATATVANGLLIGPGGFFEWNTNIPGNSVNIIGSIASNANVVLIEG